MHKRLLTSLLLGSTLLLAPAAAFAQATTVLCPQGTPNNVRCNREIPLSRVVFELYHSEIEAISSTPAPFLLHTIKSTLKLHEPGFPFPRDCSIIFSALLPAPLAKMAIRVAV